MLNPPKRWIVVSFSAVPLLILAVCLDSLTGTTLQAAPPAPDANRAYPAPPKVKEKKKDANLARVEELGKISKKAADPKEEESKVVLNDPALSKAWAYDKVSAMKAWEFSFGNKEIIVAIIDTGAHLQHEDLASNFWVNEGESGTDALGRDKRTNGVDDDKNGCVDDVHGCDMITHTGDVVDRHGHGTHIAGIIGAEAGNGKGIAGIAPKVSLMILKYFDPKHPNTNTVKNTVDAIHYAVKKGAKIINYSGGGLEYSQEEKDAVREAEKAGILFIAAAGNERSNSDLKKYYPADYGLSNIISVTAIDPKTEVLATSNFGTETVDIAAPGQNILSTLPDSGYGYMTGTSQATAFVTGAAVLVMARRPMLNAMEVKKYILATGDSNPSLIAKTRTSKQLNLYKALTMIDTAMSANGLKVANSTEDTFGVSSAGTKAPAGVLGSISNFGHQLMKKIDRQAGSN